MAQLAERLMYKHEDLASDHRNHVKSRERQQESATPVLWEQGQVDPPCLPASQPSVLAELQVQ